MTLIDFLMVNCLVLPSQEGSQKESEKGWVLPKGGHWGGAFKKYGKWRNRGLIELFTLHVKYYYVCGLSKTILKGIKPVIVLLQEVYLTSPLLRMLLSQHPRVQQIPSPAHL